MPSERIRVGEDYYLLASALAPRRPQMLLNHQRSFAIFDLAGDIPLAGREPYGLFHRGTRFLDRFELRLNDEFPVLLSSATSDDGSEIACHLSNADQRSAGDVVLKRDTISVERHKVLFDGTLHERLRLHNYGMDPLDIRLTLFFGADFADVFELRGIERARRGQRGEVEVERGRVRLGYRGLDGVIRQTEIGFHGAEWRIDEKRAEVRVRLGPGEDVVSEIRVSCLIDRASATARSYESAVRRVRDERRSWDAQFPTLYSSNEGFNDWISRSLNDLAMLRSQQGDFITVHAGIPWFATLFGRDTIITALETLGFAPTLAAGTLRALAALQGTTNEPARDEQPGKILHEMREGEMAATGEVPFGRYYGSVDATPLFLVLLSEYVLRTADLVLLRDLWPAATAAMRWIDEFADSDGDGYAEYARQSPRGLVHQGWKDSHDAISHADGTLAEPPIALAEVQAYIYAARCGMARVAKLIDRSVDAATWAARAADLRDRFHRDFWLEDEDAFALALDREKRPCRVVSSNAGQCLFSGIVEPEKAKLLTVRLMREDMECGWGIRTLSDRAPRYNPMSYHNGSVWPHDNALIAAGFARYGAREAAARLLTSLFDASLAVPDRRLPELFCGFPRRAEHSPVPYPVACKPQAWSAGCVFLLLQSVLGLTVDACARRVAFEDAALPPWLERIEIRRLRVADAEVDLCVTRSRFGAAVEVAEKKGDVEVVVRK